MLSKCVYPFPTLIIRDASTVDWIEQHPAAHNGGSYPGQFCPIGELRPVRRDVRLSFYQLDGKPWDWSRAQRLADQCYPGGHGALEIEHMGEFYAPGDAGRVAAKRPSAGKMRELLKEALNEITNPGFARVRGIDIEDMIRVALAA